MIWNLEYTDTFAGEANYSWVNREQYVAKDNQSNRSLVKEFKAMLGLTGVKGRSIWYDDAWEFRPFGRHTIAFATLEYGWYGSPVPGRSID